jgi:hypothetical protein
VADIPPSFITGKALVTGSAQELIEVLLEIYNNLRAERDDPPTDASQFSALASAALRDWITRSETTVDLCHH